MLIINNRNVWRAESGGLTGTCLMKGLTFISLFVILSQHRFIFWLRQSTLLLCTQCDPLASPPNQLHHFFLPPPSTALFSILLYQTRFNLGRGRALLRLRNQSFVMQISVVAIHT
jgi:hypothetical protein